MAMGSRQLYDAPSLRRLAVADCVSRDPIGFQFLPEANTRPGLFIGDYDTIITFDCGDARRPV